MNATVLIAVYNAQAGIARAITSALEQRVDPGDREVLVVNDGSTDGTPTVLARFGGAIRRIDQPHRGLPAACNAGLVAARGEYLMRLDADDTLDPEALAVMSPRLDLDPDAGCVYSDRIEISPSGQPVQVSMEPFNVFRTIACGILFRTAWARAIGGYDDLLFEEHDFLIRYLRAHPTRLYAPQALYRYARHPASMTAQPRYWQDGWQELLRKWGDEELARWNYQDVYQPA